MKPIGGIVPDLSGIPIFVVRPVVTTVRRTWPTRIFSLPWRPWIRWKQITHPAVVKSDEAAWIGGYIYCGPEFYRRLTGSNSIPPTSSGIEVK